MSRTEDLAFEFDDICNIIIIYAIDVLEWLDFEV